MLDVKRIRGQFPALTRTHNGASVAYFDGPAGSQVPKSVADAVSSYLLYSNANRGGPIATSRETDGLFVSAQQAVADFVGASEADEIVFGPNMTSLTYRLSDALADTWSPGDEVVVSRLDHDANVTPWVQAAESAGVIVRWIDVNLDDCTLDWDQFESLLNERTKLVAVGYASNATGTINPIARLCRAVRSACSALVCVDAVHYAPHGLIDVAEIDCDFLLCSAYKFFGPHVGVLWGRQDLLQSLQPRKLRPSPGSVPDCWMTGTQNHEGIAGIEAAIEYIAALHDPDSTDLPRRRRLAASFREIRAYEREIARVLIDGLNDLPGVKIWGIGDPQRLAERVPTVSLTCRTHTPCHLATELADCGLFTWSGNHYALPFTEAAGLEPDGTLRIGLLHYNTRDEVVRLLESLDAIVAGRGY